MADISNEKEKILANLSYYRKLAWLYKKFYLLPRTYYFLFFDRKHMIKSLELRKGSCNGCGICCRVMELKDCKHLKENGNCGIFNSWHRKIDCDLFHYPYDEQELFPPLRKICGFYWDKK